MNEQTVLAEIIKKISLKDIGTHLSNVVDLYKKPLLTWRRIISYRKVSYDFFILYVIYYSILIYFLTENSKLVLPITILELVLTLIPFFILIIPFLFFRKVWNKKMNSNKLFRLLFILKIQFNIPFLIIILIIKWTEMESLYLFVENYIWIILIAFISILPLIIKLSVLQKILWIFTNYIFCLLFFILIYFLFQLIPDSKQLEGKIEINTPTYEYLDFDFEYEYSDILMDDNYIIIIVTIDKDKAYIRNTQFSTNRLVLNIMKTDLKNSKKKNKVLDSIIKLDKKYVNIKSINFGYKIIKTETMDSIKLKSDTLFYRDLKFVDSLIKAGKFSSNKVIYKLHKELLLHYDSIYKSNQFIYKVINAKPEFSVKSDKNNYIGIYKYEDKKIIAIQKKILGLRERLKRREEYSTQMQRIFTFPIDFLLERM